jgi:hypothetical protein
MSKKAEETGNLPAVAGAVPDYMKKFMGQSQSDASSMASASNSIPRLSFRGKIFRFIKDGDEENTKQSTVKVIILGVDPGQGLFIKTFYKEKYAPGSTDPPTCSSSDGIRPDSWVSQPQAKNCSQCQQNVFGSATSQKGGKSKACKDGKRLWIARPDDIDTIYGMNVPVNSLKGLSEYGKFVAKHGMPLALMVTELSMDTESEYPKLMFNHVGFVDESLVDKVIAVNTERPWAITYVNRPLLEHDDGAPTGDAPHPADVSPQMPATPINEIVDGWS